MQKQQKLLRTVFILEEAIHAAHKARSRACYPFISSSCVAEMATASSNCRLLQIDLGITVKVQKQQKLLRTVFILEEAIHAAHKARSRACYPFISSSSVAEMAVEGRKYHKKVLFLLALLLVEVRFYDLFFW